MGSSCQCFIIASTNLFQVVISLPQIAFPLKPLKYRAGGGIVNMATEPTINDFSKLKTRITIKTKQSGGVHGY